MHPCIMSPRRGTRGHIQVNLDYGVWRVLDQRPRPDQDHTVCRDCYITCRDSCMLYNIQNGNIVVGQEQASTVIHFPFHSRRVRTAHAQ